MKNITDKLILLSIEANNWRHDEQDREITTCFQLHFEFFGVHGFECYITDDALLKDYCSCAMIESEIGELHDSFTSALEDNWAAIVSACNEWEKEKYTEQTKLFPDEKPSTIEY